MPFHTDKITYGQSNTPSENHHIDGSTPNVLSIKRGTPASPGAEVLKIDAGVVSFPQGTSGIVIGTPVATTSGASKDFTIPTWAKRITLMLTGVSTNGSSVPQIQIGTGGTPKTSGYEATAAIAGGSNQAGGALFNAGFGLVNNHSASTALDITVTLNLVNPTTNKWMATISGCVGLSTFSITGGGYVSLSGALDMVRLTTLGGTDAFDNGEWNYLVEG